MVVVQRKPRNDRTPIGYKVDARNTEQLRSIAEDACALLRTEGCYPDGRRRLDAVHLLENVLHRAGYNYHVVEEGALTETAAFTIPERRLIVLRGDIYDGLHNDDAFSRYTVVHEFSHIVLDHSIALHRGAQLGQHNWWEDSEWQANNLAAEILMPVEVVREVAGMPMLLQLECGVSAEAAGYRISNLKKKGVI